MVSLYTGVWWCVWYTMVAYSASHSVNYSTTSTRPIGSTLVPFVLLTLLFVDSTTDHDEERADPDKE